MFHKIILLIIFLHFFCCLNCLAFEKQPEFSGQFYPSAKNELSVMVDNFLAKAPARTVWNEIFMLIAPHAGYGFSGQTAAFGYKLLKDNPYKTVIILGTSHHKVFSGAAVYGEGSFVTSLGKLNVDEEFVKNILSKDPNVFLDTSAFSNEHSVEVQLPFLQRALPDFSTGGGKIVPVIVGDCSLISCKKIASLFKEVIAARKDVLLVVSTDLYHGFDQQEADRVDMLTLELIKKMDYEGLYYSLRDGDSQACGGFATVIALEIAKGMGCDKIGVLAHTNSAKVTNQSANGQWTVGYASIAAYQAKGEEMLNNQQKNRLLEIARASINTYLQTGKKMELSEADPVLQQKMGAFVTLNKHKELRGCIGNLSVNQPLYLTVRDMAVEAAVDDPRFPALSLAELKEVDVEISVLSPLKRVDSAESIELGKHGVLVRKGARSGVFLPQVAMETGWGKEDFLNNLCVHKAGIPANAWKDKDAELYIFTADVFSEKKAKKQ